MYILQKPVIIKSGGKGTLLKIKRRCHNDYNKEIQQQGIEVQK